MDELFALMRDEEVSSRDLQLGIDGGQGSAMDELVDLLEVPAKENLSTGQIDQASSVVSALPTSLQDSKGAQPLSSNKDIPATVGVDEKVQIRIIDRKYSSLDLLDLISTNPYRSPAQLSAMSLTGRCRILVDPPPSIIDPATVLGKTQLVTVGIVFTHSGTKTSSKAGSAFCVLTIGTLGSGPCVSIFLFGAAYSQFCRPCQPGQVVAVLNPKLLPARDASTNSRGNFDTSISFSIYDPSQLIHVGRSRDYGVCKAAVKSKDANGIWRNDAGRCKHYIDKRQGDYCQTHRQKSKNNGTKKGLNNNLVKQFKADRAIRTATVTASSSNKLVRAAQTCQQSTNRLLIGKDQADSRYSTGHVVTPNSTGRFSNSRSVVQGMRSVPLNMRRERGPASDAMNNERRINSLKRSSAAASSFQREVIRKPKCTNLDASKSCGSSGGKTGIHRLRDDHKKCGRGIGTNANTISKATAVVGRRTTVSGDWMAQAAASQRKRSTVSPSLPRNNQALTLTVKNGDRSTTRPINMMGGKFDGSVFVPKPNKLFVGSALQNRVMVPTSARTKTFQGNLEQEPAVDKIRDRQAKLAEQIRKKRGQINSISITMSEPGGVVPDQNNKRGSEDETSHSKPSRTVASVRCARGKKNSSEALGNAFLDSIQIDDVDAILNARSKFASEADAEEYAKSRRRLVELEKQETLETKRKAGDGPLTGLDSKLKCEWVCRTCGGVIFPKRPTHCYKANHDVKKRRSIQHAMDKETERTKLHQKRTEDGGMVLARGLDWSKFRFDRFS